MTRIVYIEPGGERREHDIADGLTLMEGAVRNGVHGIEAQCGGACSCATCHVIIEEQGYSKLAPPEGLEEGMLCGVADVRPTSRLSCQIEVRPELNGLIVFIPESQG